MTLNYFLEEFFNSLFIVDIEGFSFIVRWIDLIAQRVVDLLKPVLAAKKEKADDMIFDVKGLAEYLKVSSHWIYERTHLKQIPHIKVGGFLRFSKRDIDKWLDTYAIKSHLL